MESRYVKHLVINGIAETMQQYLHQDGIKPTRLSDTSLKSYADQFAERLQYGVRERKNHTCCDNCLISSIEQLADDDLVKIRELTGEAANLLIVSKSHKNFIPNLSCGF